MVFRLLIDKEDFIMIISIFVQYAALFKRGINFGLALKIQSPNITRIFISEELIFSKKWDESNLRYLRILYWLKVPKV